MMVYMMDSLIHKKLIFSRSKVVIKHAGRNLLNTMNSKY